MKWGSSGWRFRCWPAMPAGRFWMQAGAVIGMLLPRISEADRKLPAGVEFAASGQAIAAFLAGQGIVAKEGVQTDRLPRTR